MSIAVETFQKFQELVKDDPAAHSSNSETFVKLLSFAEDVNEPIVVRAKILQYIAVHVGKYDASVCKKVAQLAVKVISGADTVDAILGGALKLFVGLAKVPADHRPDYFVREGADVVMQVILDDAGFTVPVRTVAKEVIAELTTLNFKAVLTKLIHWISDDREADDAEQLTKERFYALSAIQTLHIDKKRYGALWTDDVQQHFLTCLAVVFPTSTYSELEKLLEIAANLPLVREKKFHPLLDSFLAASRLDTERGLVGLALVANVIPRDCPPYAQLAEKVVAQQVVRKLNISSESTVETVPAIKAVVLAARLATAEAAEPLFADVLTLLMQGNLLGGSAELPENLTVAEGALVAFTYLTSKCAAKVLPLLAAGAGPLAEAVANLETVSKLVAFDLKKKVAAGTATEADMGPVTVISNLLLLLAPLSHKHPASLATFVGSWDRTLPLPVKAKRAREEPKEVAKKSRVEQPAPAANGQQQQQKKKHHGPKRK